MSRLVVVSNRVSPLDQGKGASGGLVVGMRDVMREKGGLWFGWSGRQAESPAERPEIRVNDNVSVATIDLTPGDYRDFYAGFANRTLWPLLHSRLGYMEFDERFLGAYQRVNRRFAETLAPLLEPDDIVWVHDYHLIPLAGELRRLGVGNPVGFFLHTSLCPSSLMAMLPRHDAVFPRLADYDLVGFQTSGDLRHFLDYVERECGGGVDAGSDRVEIGARRFDAGVFPIGIDADGFARTAVRAHRSLQARRLAHSVKGRNLVIGVDRLDYTKGLPLRLKAFERLLEDGPQWRGNVDLLQIAPPSRSDVPQYRKIARDLDGLAGHVNGRFGELDWTPVHYLNKGFSRTMLAGLYRCARIGLVTPLCDGMNLVAKEYAAAQDPGDPGVLVLSRFAGAARELDGALQVNPMDVAQVAEALDRGLSMAHGERVERWQAMMAALRNNSSRVWARRFLRALQRTGGDGSAVATGATASKVAHF